MRPVWTGLLVVLASLLGACDPAAGESVERLSGEVVSVDGATLFTMDIGGELREIRLAGLNVPENVTGLAALDGFAAGARVEIDTENRVEDRYGRLIAQVYRVEDERRIWVQRALVDGGLARVYTYPDSLETSALYTNEAAARSQRRGLWAQSEHAVRDTHPDGLAQDVGSVQIIEGRILDVARPSNGRVYLNFGADWRTDFTIRIDAEHVSALEDELDLDALETYPVRVRGWLFNENGPMITLDHAGRLERLDG